MYKSFIKRAIDILCSAIAIIVFALPMAIIAICIKIDDPGPALFKQKRVGKNKELFNLYKFRSMKTDTPDVPTHLLENPKQYISGIGGFLRKTSLDELPQIYNIFMGKMSIVGPRPALWNQDDLIAERDKYGANDVLPGLTGWAQINGRDELEIPVKAKYDGEYIERMSFVFDMKCLFGTVKSVLKSDGVVEGGTGELNKNADTSKDCEGQSEHIYSSQKGTTKKMNIPFMKPDISEREIEIVCEALRSGWITTGPKTKLFEKKISEFLGVNRAVCLNSQTACAETALRILGIGEGDEVITTAYTYTASASVVCHVGAKLIMVDCQKDGLDMDFDALEAAITEKTKAIIPVDMAGIPCDYDRIFEIAERKRAMFKPSNEIQSKIGRIAIVADAAHSFGARYKGKMLGAVADFTSFSFHAVKNLTTAEGGVMTWKPIEGISDDSIYKLGQLFSLHGQSKDALAKEQVGGWEYDIVGTYYKCNMTDIAAAVGLAQLERYPAMLKRRKEIIEKYNAAFAPLGITVLDHYNDTYQSTGHLYMTRIPGVTDGQRREIIVKMAEAGITCNVHYKPLPMHTAYINMGFNIKDFPNSYDYYANEITLPCNTVLTDEEIDYIVEKYTEILKDYSL